MSKENSEHSEKKQSGAGGLFGLGNSQVFLIVLAALFVLGAVQALQFSGAINAVGQLKQSAGAGNTALVQQQATAAGNAGAQQSTPSSLQNLPDMVGGC
ncbi:MAG: hypothetical protein HY394_05235 [Candidatus Diapherotrites archaeon]|nr:hypothetical protein [Candidatus Diapherotrites archaeon]